ncbi:MAG TPA: cation:proton antiporter [Vicinamibacterales bacterium]|nr:cation:proton antiporter [Vicinamibacterales bacterium]
MHTYDLILTLTGGLGAALVLGYFTHRLGLSPIVGYLLAGTLVGPFTPGIVVDAALAEQLAEVGVILLMFGVGLQFHIEELMAVRSVAVPGAIAQSAVATVLGTLLVVALGWSWSAGVVFGMALAVASTVVLVRVLADNNDLHTQAGHIAIGWLVVEDLFTVIALVLLPAFFGSADAPLWAALGLTALKVTALVGFTAIVGTRLIPRVLDYVAHTRSRELFTLTVLVIALGIAVGSALIFSVSMALGAFLAGMIVGRSEYSLRAASEALPMRDAFAVLFFVSVGMLLDPGALMDAPALVIGALAIILIGKPLAALAIVWAMKYPFRTALTVGVALAQIGEFSFILATLGRELGLLTTEATNALVAASIASIVLNPLAYRTIGPIERRIARSQRLWALLNRGPSVPSELRTSRTAPSDDPSHRAIVVGYGPTGRTVVRLLRENGITPTVIDLNMDAVRVLRQNGLDGIYGDATRPDTLEAAGITKAGSLILASAGMAHSAEVIRTARALNPHIRVLARATYLRDVPALVNAGANSVYSGEGEVALAFIEDILETLGATPEQIDRERARTHLELWAPLAVEREPDSPTPAAVGDESPHS